MANANLALLTTANTFQDMMILDNNLANAINQLRNGLFYADNGNITLANGVLIISSSNGTVLSVSGNATISQQLTVASVLNTGNETTQGNTVLYSNSTVLVQVANTLIAKNLISNTVVAFQNVNVAGYMTLSGNNLSNTVETLIAAFNELSTLSVNGTFMVSNTGNVQFNRANGSVLNVATLNANTLSANSLNAFNIILDANDNYNIVNGNAIFNQVTIKGNQTILGTVITGSDTIQLRNNVAVDGDGHLDSWRGNTINANAQILFNHTANVWQSTANDANVTTFSTILTTSNLVDSFSNTSTTNAATANAVNAVFAAAISNASGTVANNGVYVAQRKGIDFIQTANTTLNVTANSSNTNLTDVIIDINPAANLQLTGAVALLGNLNLTPLLQNTTNGGFTTGTIDTGNTWRLDTVVFTAAANNRIWEQVASNANSMVHRVQNDAANANSAYLTIVRINANIANITIGNSIDLPALIILGNTNVSGYINATSNVYGSNLIATVNITAANGIFTTNVGVGTAAPQAAMDVIGIARANNQEQHYSNVGTITGNTNVDCRQGGFFDFLLANNANLTFQNCATAGNVTTIQVILRQSANGGNTAGFVNTVRWSDNTVPVLTATKNTADWFQFSTFNGGVIWWGAQVYANVPLANTF